MSTLPPELEINPHNADYVEALLAEYLLDPQRVPPAWRKWFGEVAGGNGSAPWRPQSRTSLSTRSIFNPTGDGETSSSAREDAQQLQHRVDQLIEAYRTRGHLRAKLDPLGLARADRPDLSPAAFGISDGQLQTPVWASLAGELTKTTAAQVAEDLSAAYCGHIGVQMMHIEEPEVRQWLFERIEGAQPPSLTRPQRHRVLQLLTEAMAFEEFVRKKYIGAKTFSLEGSETLIPLLDLAIEHAAEQGVREIVIGMPHRGRLNVLANIIRQPLRQIFAQFEDLHPEDYLGGGDVKYHLGASGDRTTTSGKHVHLSLCFNPSHLEFVNPVALGRVRAKQDRIGDTDRRQGMGVLIHGDAAFAGEGVVQETLVLSQLPGYRTGGTLHVITNNQLGFTTRPEDSRSSTYASDVARMLQIPILHVNGEHPEAVARAVRWVMEFREEFQRDVVIDLYCYRRFGHNEADEPSFTQPLMYQAIEHHPSIRQTYMEELLADEALSSDEAEAMTTVHHNYLKAEHEAATEVVQLRPSQPLGIWHGYLGGSEPPLNDDNRADDVTSVPVSERRVADLLRRITTMPDGFHLHRKLQRLAAERRAMAAGERPLDWSTAEALAIASLAIEGHRVRLSGQDSQRGTFSQRHAVLHDVVDGHTYNIFSKLDDDQAPVEIINSPLNESGVLGFDYGYSLDYPDALVAWEAQFGDFANAGQVIIDQFITSAEDKWRRLSGLVLLLPHGFEGQGPEHSSARLERLLALAAEDNIQVTNPTTPAQYFHLLRRQVTRSWCKPLVVLTPKSLLRHAKAVSQLSELTTGGFRRVLPDERVDPKETKRILLCSGKVYYDLADYREEHGCDDVAIVRVEQFYPLPDEVLQDAIGTPDEQTPIIWVQEEPANMGAWPRWRRRYGERMLGRYPLEVVARQASASPATGSKAAHKLEQKRLMQRAFDHS